MYHGLRARFHLQAMYQIFFQMLNNNLPCNNCRCVEVFSHSVNYGLRKKERNVISQLAAGYKQ